MHTIPKEENLVRGQLEYSICFDTKFGVQIANGKFEKKLCSRSVLYLAASSLFGPQSGQSTCSTRIAR